MQYPDFYSQVTPIKLYDPLSDFLGAFTQGVLEISYLDCVKLAGHSCPTVAGAYLMAAIGIDTLYGDTLPQRGSVKVEMKENESAGVTGVTANIISFILGAGGVGGFKGIQGNFSRDNLLFYGASINAEVRLTRLDTMQSVNLSYDPSLIKADEKMMPLMGKNLKGLATKEEQKMFHTLWQKRVEEILLKTDSHSKLISITKD
jgi:formylmethanofuran dehydrogenase subunit E